MLQSPMDNRGLRCQDLVALLLIQLVVIKYVAAQSNALFPVLYPAVAHTNFFVEDMVSRQLSSGHGALPWFLCSEKGRPNRIASLKQPLPRCRELVIRTQESYLNLTLSVLDGWGAQEYFSRNPDFQVKQVKISSKPPIAVARHRKDKEDPAIGRNRTVHQFTETILTIPTVKFVVSVGLLKKNLPVLLQISVEGQTRQIMAISDPDPPKASITYKMDSKSKQPVVKSVIQFSEGVVPVAKSSNIEPCDADLQPLSQAVTFLDMINSSLSACGSVGGKWSASIELFGATRGVASYDPTLTRLKVQAFVEKGVPSDIIIRLRNGSFIDLAGNLNDETVATIVYYRPTVVMPSSERRQRLLSRKIVLPPPEEPAVNTGAAAAMGAAASAAAAAAAVASTAASAGGGGGGGSPVDIVGMAQKMYLTGRMAISEFPENYGAFTAQLNWAMFDISTPWEKAKQRSEELKDENATVTSKGIENEDEEEEEEEGVNEKIESITSLLEAQDDDESPYDHLKRVFFWVPLGYIVLLTLHSSCLCCCLCKRKPIPDILQFPRLELMFGFWAIPAIAGASAGLYQGNRVDALFGTWLLIVFPVSFMAWNVFMLYHHFYSRHPAERKANMVLVTDEPPEYVAKNALSRAIKRVKTVREGKADTEKRNIWESTGSKSPVGFVNPAFLTSGDLSFVSTTSERQELGLDDLKGAKPVNEYAKDLKMQPAWFNDFQNQWRKTMNHNLDGMVAKNRVNNALVIPSITRAGHDDGASDEVDDLMMSSTGNSSTTFSPNQASWNETPVSTYRSNDGFPSARSVSMPKEIHRDKDPVPEIAETSELRISVLAPDVAWSKVDLMVVEATQENQTLKCVGWKERPAGVEPVKEDKIVLRRALLEVFDLIMVSLFLGRRQEDGEWITTSKTHSKFIARYGPLFEDHRGHPVVRREATYRVDPRTGKLDRGRLIPVKRRPLFKIPALKLPFTNLIILPSKKIYRFQLQILTRLLDFTKIILLACLIEAVGDGEDSMNQVLALFVVSAINLVVVRIARPFPTRLDMTITVLAEGADVVTFFLGIILLLGPNHDRDFRIKVGKGMLYAEGGAFLSMIIERLCMGAMGLTVACSIFQKEKIPKMADIVFKAMEHSDGYLAKKYGDRWMVKALKRGLHNRPLRREELPVWYYLKMTVVKPFLTFSWFNYSAKTAMHVANQGISTGLTTMKTLVRIATRDPRLRENNDS